MEGNARNNVVFDKLSVCSVFFSQIYFFLYLMSILNFTKNVKRIKHIWLLKHLLHLSTQYYKPSIFSKTIYSFLLNIVKVFWKAVYEIEFKKLESIFQKILVKLELLRIQTV